MITLYFARGKKHTYVFEVLSRFLCIDVSQVKISRDTYGKPFLYEYPAVHVNVSHAKGITVCAIADKPIGVDIERIRHADRRILARYFSRNEKAYVQAHPDGEGIGFTEIWTRKEAYLKWLGRGIQLPLELFDSLAVPAEQVCIDTRRIADYIVSTCYQMDTSGEDIELVMPDSLELDSPIIDNMVHAVYQS